MTTFFLDPEGGNDANAGTSFALRWKTINGGATAARTAPGDTIRIMASRDPISMGSVAWTDNSNTLTLPSAKNITVSNCESAWTASANITTSLSTAYVKQGSNSLVVTPAAGFTTGLVAYFATGALDLSGYQQLSFWLRSTAGINASTYKIALCSDAAGAVPVDELTLTSIVSSGWQCFVLDKGSPLGSNIQSIALYALLDPGTSAIHLDNIIACKSPGDANELTHLSLIGKNTAGEPSWYPINSINGTDVRIGGYNATGIGSSDTSTRTFRGISESVTSYAVNPVNLRAFGLVSESSFMTNKAGVDGSEIVYSGGWDRADMSTQSGETWWSGSHIVSRLLYPAQSFLEFNNIGVCHTPLAPIVDSAFNTLTVDLAGLSGCGTLLFSSLGNQGLSLTIDRITNCANGLTWSGLLGRLSFNFDAIVGCNTSAFQGVPTPGGTRLVGNQVKNCGTWGYVGVNPGVIDFGQLMLSGITFENNASGDVTPAGGSGTNTRFLGCTFNSATKIASANLSSYSSKIWCQKYGGVADDHRVFAKGWNGATDATVRHTASGIAWKLNPTDSTNCTSYNPAEIPLGKIAFAASSMVTVSCWCRRSNTGLAVGIKVPGGQIAGVASDVKATMTAAADTWEQVSITFTPTEAGVLEVTGYAYGGSAYSGYFDDLTASQA